MHKSGFVNIIGNPNVGKSTLMNQVVGEKMSIINAKPQTTRHRILGIVNEEDYQIVFSDTPGLISDPAYQMQAVMNKFALSTFEDADVMLLVIDPKETAIISDSFVLKMNQLEAPKLVIINKIDLITEEELVEISRIWKEKIECDEVIGISALTGQNVDKLLTWIVDHLPECPPYYPKDQLTDRPERFFVAEIIRGNILDLYHQEIPYSCEIVIDSFQEMIKNDQPFVKIFANIYVSRKTQKSIIIGKGGQAIKKLGIASRIQIEEFLDMRCHLELFVKIKDDWRNNERQLSHFGYV